MGEAKQIVEGPANMITDGIPVIDKVDSAIDDIDRAIEIKLHDLDVEGTDSKAENHFKLGILRAADSLLRRAAALLKDYGSDLDNDVDPSEDMEAACGEEFERGYDDDEPEEDDDEPEEDDDATRTA